MGGITGSLPRDKPRANVVLQQAREFPMTDRNDWWYRVTFIPECGNDFQPTLVAEVQGWRAAYDAAYAVFQEQRDDGTLDDVHYAKTIAMAEKEFAAFKADERQYIAVLLCYGTVVISS